MVKRKKNTDNGTGSKSPTENGMTVNDKGVVSDQKSLCKSSNGVTENFHETRSKHKALTIVAGIDQSNGKDNVDKDATCQAVRSSTRVLKRTKKDAGLKTIPADPPLKRIKKDKGDGTKKRNWEVWSTLDVTNFFHAVSEFGKEFDSIQNYIANKQRKRNESTTLVKNKDQVRHFYYRTWHKISKFVNAGEDIKKQAIELYSIINYGELRRRLGNTIDPKLGEKLNELIHKGSTVVKIKGKKITLKTPVCKALKKLNNIEDPKPDLQIPKIPSELKIELHPRTNVDFAHVQSLAKNPRVRMTVKTDRRLSSIIEYLQKKWKTSRIKVKSSLKCNDEKDMQIKLFPAKSCTIVPVTIKNKDTRAKVDVTLDSYKESIKSFPSLSSKEAMLKQKECSGDKNKEIKQNESLCAKEMGLVKDNNKPQRISDFDVNPLPTFGRNITQKNAAEEQLQIEIAKIRNGWTIEDSNSLTVAELYLMFGSQDIIHLEYEWTELAISAEHNKADILKRLVNLAKTEYIDTAKSKHHNADSPCRLCGRFPTAITPSVNRMGQSKSPAAQCIVGRTPTTPRGASKRNSESGTPKSSKTAQAEKNHSKDSAFTAFRVPAVVPIAKSKYQVPDTKTQEDNRKFIEQLDSLNKQASLLRPKARNRLVRKPLLVQRTLLPKAQVPSRQVVALAMLPSTSQASSSGTSGSFMPVVPNQPLPGQRMSISPIIDQNNLTPPEDHATPTSSSQLKHAVPRRIAPQTVVNAARSQLKEALQKSPSYCRSVMKNPDTNRKSRSIISTAMAASSIISTSNNSLVSQPLSSLLSEISTSGTYTKRPSDLTPLEPEPSIGLGPLHLPGESNLATFLDLSIPEGADEKLFGDIDLSSSVGGSSSFSDYLGAPVKNKTSVCDDPNLFTPPLSSYNGGVMSPFKISSPEKWLGGEVPDLSLSFLSDSPLKKPETSLLAYQHPVIQSEGSNLTRYDVDSALQAMMNENSIDYASKFAELAAQVAGCTEQLKPAEN